MMPLNEIVENQLSVESDVVAGLSTRNQGYEYKKILYERRKPDILILGSSRVLQFRQEFFKKRMTNIGGSMSSISQGFTLLKNVLSVHHPELIILGVDYWWFDETYVSSARYYDESLNQDNTLTMKSLLTPYKWLYEKKIKASEYFKTVLQLHPSIDKIGVDGVLKKTGFLKDGSYVYSRIITGNQISYSDINFKDSMGFITLADQKLQREEKVSSIHMLKFLDMIQYIKQKNIPLVVLMPPIAPTLEKKMIKLTNLTKYIEELKKLLMKNDVDFYDFHKTQSVEKSNCEFIDGLHGGDVLYAKMLLYIHKKEPLLNDYVNKDYLEIVSERFKDMAMIPRPSLFSEPEIDFMKISCQKKPKNFIHNS